jgi:leader peptidase (prepilin peptidase)/N-methyltransferase
VGGVILGGIFYLLAAMAPRTMGRGDAKLGISIGIALSYLSWVALLVGTFLAFVLGAVVGLVGVLSRRMTLKSALPFGPCLLLGCWLTLAIPSLSGPVQGVSF